MLCVLLQGDPFRRLVWHTHPTARSLPSSGSGPMGSRPGARTPGLWEGAGIVLSLGRTLVISRSPSSPKSRSSAPSGSARSSSPRRAAFNISLTRSSNGAVARRCASVIVLARSAWRQGERANEMELEQPNAANTSCIQHLPMMLGQQWFFVYWQLSLQCPQHASKFLAVLLLHGIVARKMDIDTAPCQLWSHGAKPSHLIGAHQNMADPRSVFQGLQMIKLVGQGPTASRLG